MKNLNLNQNIINKNYFIDSRDVKENSVFICIKGPNNDGHNYVNYVLNNFNKTIVVCEKHWKYAKKFEKNKRVIFCDSTRKFIKNLAQIKRLIFNNNFFIGITGS